MENTVEIDITFIKANITPSLFLDWKIEEGCYTPIKEDNYVPIFERSLKNMFCKAHEIPITDDGFLLINDILVYTCMTLFIETNKLGLNGDNVLAIVNKFLEKKYTIIPSCPICIDTCSPILQVYLLLWGKDFDIVCKLITTEIEDLFHDILSVVDSSSKITPEVVVKAITDHPRFRQIIQNVKYPYINV